MGESRKLVVARGLVGETRHSRIVYRIILIFLHYFFVKAYTRTDISLIQPSFPSLIENLSLFPSFLGPYQ